MTRRRSSVVPRRIYVLDQFWSKVTKTPNCWLWCGAKTYDGYGVIKLRQQRLRTHRVSWELSFGQIPDGLFVLHRCDNPPCVRPDHLFLGTKQDNNRDAVSKGRWANGSDKPDHRRKRGEDSPTAKLNDAQVKELRHLHERGTSTRSLAIHFGVGIATVYRTIRRETWKHVP